MTPKDLLNRYRTGYKFHKETGMAANSFHNWRKWGYVPEFAQIKLERITKGELKAEIKDE